MHEYGSTNPATGKVVRLSWVINELAKVVEDDVANNHSFLKLRVRISTSKRQVQFFSTQNRYLSLGGGVSL